MRPLLLLFIFLFTFAGVFAQETVLRLNLDQVIEMTLKQNLDFRMSAEKLERFRQAEKEARAQKFAQLDFQASYSRLSEVMEINIPTPSIPGLPVQIPSQSIKFGDGNELEFYLQFSQPLYTGGALKSLAKAASQDVLGLLLILDQE